MSYQYIPKSKTSDLELWDSYLARIADDWINYFSSPEDVRDIDENLFNPWGLVNKLVHVDGNWAWNLIEIILERDKEGKSLDILAAGPLEDLIVIGGDDCIEATEAWARADERFRRLLAGVWQSDTKRDVWERIVAARGNAMPF